MSTSCSWMVLHLQCHVCVDSVQLSTEGHLNGYPSWSSSGEKWIETGVFMILASQLFNLGDLSGDPWFRFGLFFKLSPRSLPLKTVQQHGSLIPGRQELAFIREPKAWIYKFGWGKKTVKSYWRWLFRWRLGRFGHDDKNRVTMGESSSLILPRDLY